MLVNMKGMLDAANRDGYAVVVKEYDANGSQTSVTYLDANHQPVDTAMGYARAEMTTDHQGHTTGEAYFDASLQPVALPAGYHRVAYAWDADGRLLSHHGAHSYIFPFHLREGGQNADDAATDRGRRIEVFIKRNEGAAIRKKHIFE